MDLRTFIATYTGQSGVGDTPENIGQCVGLVEVWIDNLKLPHDWGNAKDLLADADPASFTAIQNSPTNFPQPGDIVVWDSSWGNGNGHTGIAVTADANGLQAFEQNDPDGSTPHTKQYTYAGVLGWLHPKPQDSTAADLAACLAQHTQLVTQLDQAKATIDNLNQQTTKLNAELNTAQARIAQLQPLADQVASLQQQAIEANTLRIQAEADRTRAQTDRDAAVKALATAQANDYTRLKPSTLLIAFLQSLIRR